MPPLGKAVEARIEEKEGYCYLTIRQVEYDVYEQIDWNNDFIKASFLEDQSPFVEPEFDPPSELELSIDPHNFASRSEYEDYVDSLKSTKDKLLLAKRQEESLTESEYQELIVLSDQYEQQNAERMKHIVQLASIRGISLTELMDQLELWKI